MLDNCRDFHVKFLGQINVIGAAFDRWPGRILRIEVNDIALHAVAEADPVAHVGINNILHERKNHGRIILGQPLGYEDGQDLERT